MAEAENKPSIRIHIDQQVAIDAVTNRDEVEDATVSTEITGFDVEGDSYILKGGLTLSGFLRQADESGVLPDAFEDQDVFGAEEAAEAQLLPLHQRLPFVLQVPVAAQQTYQRETGILNVNPKIGQWNLHVLGDKTLHLRCELVLQGLSGQEGYVFRCGTQEEGVAATRLDQLLEEETARNFVPPTAQVEEEFVPPFEPAWRLEEDSIAAEAQNESAEDDWVIETPQTRSEEDEEAAVEEEDEKEVVFTPDPSLNFPLPDASLDWANQLQATDRLFNEHQQVEQEHSYAHTPAQAEFDPYEQVRQSFAPNQFDSNQWQQQEQPQAQAEFDPYEQVRQSFAPNQFDSNQWQQQEQPQAQAEFDPYEQVRQSFAPNQFDSNQWQPPVDNQWQPPVDTNQWQPPAAAFEDPYSQVRQQFQPYTYEPQEEEQPTYREEAFQPTPQIDAGNPWQQPIVSDFNNAWQEPAVQAEVQREDDADEDAFFVERSETPAVEVPAPAPASQQQADQADEATEAEVVEYTFEDELPKQEQPIEVVPAALEQAKAPASLTDGPKISFAGKPREEMEAPVNLSAIFGERTESAPILARESSSSSHHHHHHHHGHQEEYQAVIVAPVNKDSIWSGMLGSAKESKATLKFHIVHVEESLPSVAERYGTSINDLMRSNNLQNQELDLGQILYIPVVRR